MESSEFKSLFGDVARAHGFRTAHGGWLREAPAALFILSLQKSNFGNYFELNFKLFLWQGLPNSPAELKKMVKSLSGDIFRRQPPKYDYVFDLDTTITTAGRRTLVDQMFTELVDQIASGSASPAGILGLRDAGLLFLLPMAEAQLRIN